jgi:hypothetical protein
MCDEQSIALARFSDLHLDLLLATSFSIYFSRRFFPLILASFFPSRAFSQQQHEPLPRPGLWAGLFRWVSSSSDCYRQMRIERTKLINVPLQFYALSQRI